MTLFRKQKQFVNALKSKKYRYLLYGGGVAGGKTILTLGLFDEFCQMYPGVRFAVIRKSLATIRRNTIPSYNKVLELFGDPKRAKLNKSEWTARYANGSEILFVEADISGDPELNKLRGLEITAALMEEANECSELAFNTIITRIGRWRNAEHKIPPFVMMTCNPDNNWVKDKFYDPWVADKLQPPYYFLQALPQDNPHNTKEYLEALEDLPEAEYQRYVKGNWEYSSDPNQLILYSWFKKVITNISSARIPKYLGIDVAREGNDKTVFCYMDDDGIIGFKEFKHERTDMTADVVELEMIEKGIAPQHIGVDGIGLGAGLVDCLAAKRIRIQIFKSSEKPVRELEHFRFINRRAEAHWLLREDIKDERITVPYHKELQKQTMQLKYFVKEKYIQIENKEAIKKRLGYSPDHAEAAIICNWVRRGLMDGGPINTNYIQKVYRWVGGSRARTRTTAVKQMVY